jgi:hypothetical protein
MGRESRRNKDGLDETHIRVEVFRYNVPGVGEVVWDITFGEGVACSFPAVCWRWWTSRWTRWSASWRATNTTRRGYRTWTRRKPGIAAPLVFDGRIAYVLIDGQHRCARALRDGIVFKAQLLTDAAARLCLIDCPPSLSPF